MFWECAIHCNRYSFVHKIKWCSYLILFPSSVCLQMFKYFFKNWWEETNYASNNITGIQCVCWISAYPSSFSNMTQILTFICITFKMVVNHHQSSSFISNGLTKQEESPKNSPLSVVTLAYSPLHISYFHFISTSYVLETAPSRS